jgi:hypothetical protein
VYPRRTVDIALLLSRCDVYDREIAVICGTSVWTIRHWRSKVQEPKRIRQPSCPRCEDRPLDNAAYAYLLGLYLGDGCLTRGPRDVYALCLLCCDDWPGLIDAAKAAMAAVMPSSSVFCVQRTGCKEIKSTSKHWPCLFPQHGPGRKHTRKIELQQWQQEIAAVFPGDFARGLFHSDGYRGMNRVKRKLPSGERWYEYPRYFFSNESTDILGLCGWALDELSVSWRFARPNMISVARREAVARLDEFVGPKY